MIYNRPLEDDYLKFKNDRDNLVLYRGPTSFILMNLYPYNNGHIMVCPYNHIETTKSLSNESMKEIMMLADKSMDIFRDVMDAQGFNFGANIGISTTFGTKTNRVGLKINTYYF